jgi:formate hydrogenlyase subunit 3/multisubunit Na+/H+ antiporter MnhD subunit
VSRVPRWRLAAGILVLAALGFFAAVLAPIYLRNFQFHEFLSGLAHNLETRERSGDALLGMVLAKARSLNLPVTASEVQITRTGEEVRIVVRYVVKVDLPAYTVELHF